MYRAIIFDFYDVLHSGTLQFWLASHGLERTGKVAEVFDLVDSGAIDRKEFYVRLGDFAGISPRKAQKTFEVDGVLNKKLVNVIKNLKKNYKIGLISNAQSAYLRHLFERYNLYPLFDELIISDEVGFVKPDPRIFEEALDRLDVAAEEAIFIDDNPVHTSAAESLGVKALVYTDVPRLLEDLGHAEIKVVA